MSNSDLTRPWYTPERDGTLEEYLREFDGNFSMPLFRGYEHYKMLWEKGYIVPQYSYIRLMWNIGRDDEHFNILAEFEIEGVSYLKAHAGRPGIFDPSKLLAEEDCPHWEIHCLHPKARRIS